MPCPFFFSFPPSKGSAAQPKKELVVQAASKAPPAASALGSSASPFASLGVGGDAVDEMATVFVFTIPDTCVGTVIGKSGAVIKEIVKKSKVEDIKVNNAYMLMTAYAPVCARTYNFFHFSNGF
jgi:hypothetical protein